MFSGETRSLTVRLTLAPSGKDGDYWGLSVGGRHGPGGKVTVSFARGPLRGFAPRPPQLQPVFPALTLSSCWMSLSKPQFSACPATSESPGKL